MIRKIMGVLLSWWFSVVMIAWLYMFMQLDTTAAWVGKYWPVTGPLQIISIEPAVVNGAPGSKIRGFAMLDRDECDYMSVEWKLHGDHRSVNVNAFFEDEAQIRKRGRQEWQALMVGVPPHKISATTGSVRHQCGTFPVMTPFFMPDKSVIPTETGATAICMSGAYSTSIGPGTCSGHGGVAEWILSDEKTELQTEDTQSVQYP